MSSIRMAESKDKDTIINLYHSLIGIEGCAWSLEYPTIENVLDDIERHSLYCLCDSSGDIVAAAAAGIDNELDHLVWDENIKKPCELARVGVKPLLHNKGYGRTILDFVMHDVKKRGFDGIRMLVSKTNPAAIALYGKLGFHCRGEANMYGRDWFYYEKVL